MVGRLRLRAKLDAVYFHLCGVTDDIAYIYSTFPIVERHEEAAWGYRSRDPCLACMNALAAGRPDADKMAWHIAKVGEYAALWMAKNVRALPASELVTSRRLRHWCAASGMSPPTTTFQALAQSRTFLLCVDTPQRRGCLAGFRGIRIRRH